MSRTQNFLELEGGGLAWEIPKKFYGGVCEGVRGGSVLGPQPMGKPPPFAHVWTVVF